MRLNTLLSFALAAVLLAGCGFKLRGQVELPFASAYVDAPAGTLTEQLKRSLRASNTTLASKREEAEVTIKLTNPTRGKSILSLSGAGRVAEYRLEYKLTMSALDAEGNELLPESEILMVRDFTYSDAQILAKENEEGQLFQNMEQDALRAILIRLRFAKAGGVTKITQ